MNYCKLAALSAVLTLFWGCALQPKVPDELRRDNTLSAVQNVLAVSDRNAIAFEWDPIDNPLIAGFLVYRGEPSTNLTRIGSTATRFNTHFVDSKELQQSHQYVYRISYYTTDGRESSLSENIIVSTEPLPEPISFIASVPSLPRMGKIVFRPHPNERISGYRVERRTGKTEWQSVGKIDGRLNGEFIDEKLSDNTEYEYRVVALTHDGLQTRPSDIVITVTKQLPSEVKGFTASTTYSDKIELKWTRLANDQSGEYRIYASGFERLGFSVIATVKARGAAAETGLSAGKERFYKVTFVDADGLESPLAATAVKGATAQPEGN
ncbi:hypothetical protein FACS1894103_3020 [Campylobacterota bacterium]|nr:hypothetical protein FACS1894103_3020 [Campylobacterota bacterium]